MRLFEVRVLYKFNLWYEWLLDCSEFIILIQSKMKNKRIESYHITNHLLGSGSFSQVYLGHSPNEGKVAVKVIPRDRIKGTTLNKPR